VHFLLRGSCPAPPQWMDGAGARCGALDDSILTPPCSLRNLGCVGHIEDISVAKDQQGKKLGLRIIQALDAIAQEKGCYKAILDCSEHNRPFYEKCGYKLAGVQMVSSSWRFWGQGTGLIRDSRGIMMAPSRRMRRRRRRPDLGGSGFRIPIPIPVSIDRFALFAPKEWSRVMARRLSSLSWSSATQLTPLHLFH
jgi:hypothetical protein